MTETVKRIIDLMKANNDTAHALELKAKLPQASISAWKNDRYKPSAEAIINLSRYFNVSADYLLCLADDPQPLTEASAIERPTTSLSTALAKDQRFVNSAKLYNAMPNEYQSEVYAYIFGVAVGLGLNVKQILKK